MIEQIAAVAAVSGPGQVRLAVRPQQGCARCERGEGCGGGLLGKLVRRLHTGLELADPGLDLRPGERVVIGVAASRYLAALGMIYLFPLAGLFAGAGLAAVLFPGADPLAALFGLAGLAAAAMLARGLPQGASPTRLQPRILRRASLSEINACAQADPSACS